MENVSERIKYLRKHVLKMNQKDFAAALGVGGTHISGIEASGSNPSELLLTALSHRSGINYQWLVNGKGEMRADSVENQSGINAISLKQALLIVESLAEDSKEPLSIEKKVSMILKTYTLLNTQDKDLIPSASIVTGSFPHPAGKSRPVEEEPPPQALSEKKTGGSVV